MSEVGKEKWNKGKNCFWGIQCFLLPLNHYISPDMGQVQLLEKVKKIPPAYQQEVEDFIDFILSKKRKSLTSKVVIPQRTIGLLKGKLQMSSDFDEPLDDFKGYM